MKPIWPLCAVILPAVVQAQFTFITNNGPITITGNSSYFSDPQWTNFSSQFYCLRWPSSGQ